MRLYANTHAHARMQKMNLMHDALADAGEYHRGRRIQCRYIAALASEGSHEYKRPIAQYSCRWFWANGLTFADQPRLQFELPGCNSSYQIQFEIRTPKVQHHGALHPWTCN